MKLGQSTYKCRDIPVPLGPASMTGLRIPTNILIQNVTEHVSGVGTVTEAIGVVESYSNRSADKNGLLDHNSKVLEVGSYQ